MTGLTRRRFLAGSVAAGAALGMDLLPPALRNVLADDDRPLESLRQIEHVVIFMQENRSFDHYFGTLSGVRGFDDRHAIRLPNGRSVFYQPDPKNPDGYLLPFHLDTTKTKAAAVADTSHAWSVQHQTWDGGRMDDWVPAHRAADGDTDGPMTMGYYKRNDLPFHYALADAFTICDMYFCSVFGPTNPNRLYTMTGTIDPEGKAGGPVVDNSETPPYTWTTYPERLQAAGVSWRVYQHLPDNYDDNALAWFKQYQTAPPTSPLYQNGMAFQAPDAFMTDVANNRLPQVSWIVSPAEQSEHPSYLPAAGAQYIYDRLEALARNREVWSKTVVFLNYDENDGFFDHVVPPTAPPGTPGEYLTTPLPPAAHGIAGPIGLGYRVPMIVISPWSRGGWVSSQVFDHTSTLRFLEARFGVRESNISAWRRRTCGDLTSPLRLHHPDIKFPALPDPAPLLAAELVEVATLPAPTPPTEQVVPHQDPGRRPHTGEGD